MSRETLQRLFDQAIGLHQQGALADAERLYTQVLAIEPASFGPRHMLGVIRAQQGRGAEAVALIGSALELNPGVAPAWINHGNVLAAMGRLDEAAASYSQALALTPGDGALRNRRGDVFRLLKRYEEAIADYEKVLAAHPDEVEARLHHGIALAELGRHDEAVAAYDRVLALRPDLAEAWNNRGFSLRELTRFTEALDSVDKALALKPDYAAALANRGKILSESDRIADSFAAYLDTARVMAAQETPGDAAHKLRHDEEQHAWLAANGIGTASELQLIGGARIPGPAINPANAALAARWPGAQPQLLVIDDLLTPEALAALRHYCLASNMWRNVHPDGYLGAFPENGFAAPLVAQIAEEMRDTFPAIFAGHPLRYHWAFKYDSSLSGIEVHADEAAVNVNFWITPDVANTDPESGGMVVWDKAAPLHWDFAKFNADPAAAYDFLEKSGARAITVPHRANRAVIFDSNLFHRTDTIAFAPGYENRRVNVTLLFGRRR